LRQLGRFREAFVFFGGLLFGETQLALPGAVVALAPVVGADGFVITASIEQAPTATA
jgi:hypothetical protein